MRPRAARCSRSSFLTRSVHHADLFLPTWTLGDPLKVVQDKKVADKSSLKTGEEIGVAGTKDGSATDARLIAVR
jgi:hypothetical protein